MGGITELGFGDHEELPIIPSVPSEHVAEDLEQESTSAVYAGPVWKEHFSRAADLAMQRRIVDIKLDRDSDYPRFSEEYFRRRWSWEVGEVTGNAAFAVTALFCVLNEARRQRPSRQSIQEAEAASSSRTFTV